MAKFWRLHRMKWRRKEFGKAKLSSEVAKLQNHARRGRLLYEDPILPYKEDSLADLPLDEFDNKMSAIQKSIRWADE